MNEYTITHDFLEIVSGTTNSLHPVYMEASENIKAGNATGYGYLRNFVKSIDQLSKKGLAKDERISSTEGQIKDFEGYDSINFAIDFLTKNVSGLGMLSECKTIKSKLEEFSSLYQEGYSKKARLVMMEYETAVYLLVTALAMIMATNVDVVSNGVDIKVRKKSAQTNGVITRMLGDYAKQLGSKDHKQYLQEMLKSIDDVGPSSYDESVMTEGAVDEILAAIEVMLSGGKKIGKFAVHLAKGVKNSLFGTIPLIRSCLYLKYKKKADTISALDQQCQFIKMNIDQLKNMKDMDEKKKQAIIKKQEATVEAYQKKAEKLRAQLVETEKEVATAIQKENPQIKSNSKDDEFVLEFGKTVEEVFPEVEEGD